MEKEKEKNRHEGKTLLGGSAGILSWSGREQEILIEMKEYKIDICALSETKRKNKGDLSYPEYILKYSGNEKHKRATAGVGILIKEKYRQNIKDTLYQ